MGKLITNKQANRLPYLLSQLLSLQEVNEESGTDQSYAFSMYLLIVTLYASMKYFGIRQQACIICFSKERANSITP